MNKKFFMLMIVFAALLAIGLLAMPNSNVQAQAGGPGCVDATGASCTPTPESGGGSGGGSGSGNQNPTSTPLPITNPTEAVDTAGATWSGTCKGTIQETTTCIGQFTNGCGHVGGSTSSTVNKDGSVDLTCTVPLIFEPTPFPLSAGPEEDDLIGTCSEAQGNVLDCLGELQRQCEDGLLVIEVDLYATGGTSYKVYCIPHEKAPTLDLPYRFPEDNGATEDNWTGGCAGGDGLDTCLDIYADACAADGGDMSVWYDDDGGAGVYCENQSEASQPAPTEAPAIVAAPDDSGSTEGNKDWDEQCSWGTCWAVDLACWIDGGSGYGVDDGAGGVIYHCDMPSESSSPLPPFGFGFLIGVVAAVAIPAFMKNARKAKTSEAVTNVKKMYDSSGAMPQTKEHVLLNKDDGDTSSASKPKPKPTPPPSQPKPSSGPKGDFNSDADVDGSDFNP